MRWLYTRSVNFGSVCPSAYMTELGSLPSATRIEAKVCRSLCGVIPFGRGVWSRLTSSWSARGMAGARTRLCRLSLSRLPPVPVGNTRSSGPERYEFALWAASSSRSSGKRWISRRPACVFERPMWMRPLARSTSRQSRLHSSCARGPARTSVAMIARRSLMRQTGSRSSSLAASRRAWICSAASR